MTFRSSLFYSCHVQNFNIKISFLFHLKEKSADSSFDEGVAVVKNQPMQTDRMISLCTSWALFSLSIVALMVYLPVEISTAVLSFYLYNMVSYHVVGVVFLTQSPSLTQI
jgi:hypothetical protein